MYQPLIPCDGCARHVLASEESCPFCGRAIAAGRIAPDTTRRMTRAAAFVFGATMAVAACSSDVETSDDDGAAGHGVGGMGGFASAYGAAGGVGGAGAGIGGGGALYGAPGGFGGEGGSGGDAGGAAGEGGAQNLYDAPPP
jgi:hypothetical protein